MTRFYLFKLRGLSAVGTGINRYANHEQILAEPQCDEKLMTGENCNNFRGNANKSFFCKYIAKPD